jgi:hypothetical protein
MKNKWLLAIPIIICLVLGYYYIHSTLIFKKSKITKETLKKLEAEGIFCSKILNVERTENGINLFGFCNGRPLSFMYINNTIMYSPQALDWIKETPYNEELNGCSFYKSEKIEENLYKLYFYCSLDQIKTYSFDISNAKMKKLEELEFPTVFLKDFKKVYKGFSECKYKNSNVISVEGYPYKFILFTISCNEGDFLIIVPSAFHSILLPVLLDKDYENIARISFNKIFGEIGKIDECGPSCVSIQGSGKNSALTVFYDFNNYPFVTSHQILLDDKDAGLVLSNLGKYFIPFMDFRSVKCPTISSGDMYCKVNGGSVAIFKPTLGNIIIIMGRN